MNTANPTTDTLGLKNTRRRPAPVRWVIAGLVGSIAISGGQCNVCSGNKIGQFDETNRTITSTASTTPQPTAQRR